MLAIVAAVPDETWLFRHRLFPCEVRRCGHRDLYCGSMFGQKIVILHTGVGKINAASAVTALLEDCTPETLIVTGCCGAYAEQGLSKGDLVLASEEICADEGVLTPDGFRDFATLGFALLRNKSIGLQSHFPVDVKLQESARAHLERFSMEQGVQLGIGPLVTVSTCSGTSKSGREMQARTGGMAENMEGAAVAQVCLQYKVPFLELRGISNMVEDRDLQNWDLAGAAETAQQALVALLHRWFAPELLA